MSFLGSGGTTLGIKTKYCVVLASDTQYIAGSSTISKSVKKVFKISDKVYISASGVVADIQGLVKNVRYLLGVRSMKLEGRSVSVDSVARLISVLLYSNKAFPYYTQILVGGFDTEPKLYSLDSLGSIMPDDYTALGSGAETALSVLDSGFSNNLQCDELMDLALEAMKAVSSRDVLTGNEIDIVVINKDSAVEKRISIVPKKV